MASTMFMRVDEVAEELGVSVPYAYKLIRSDVYKRQREIGSDDLS